MYSYASLAAEQHALSIYKEIFSTFNIERIGPKDARRILAAHKTLTARNRLLNREITFESEDDALMFCWAELEVHRYIKREVWASGKVKYMMALRSIVIEANIESLGALTINRMLLEGYKFEENIGEHFVITTPQNGVRATSARNCTCGAKQCNHLIAVNEILKNRKGCRGLYTISG